mgnify:CR=1 FL=1
MRDDVPLVCVAHVCAVFHEHRVDTERAGLVARIIPAADLLDDPATQDLRGMKKRTAA